MPPYAGRGATDVDEAPYPPVDGTQPCAGEDPDLFFLERSSLDNAYKLPRALDCCDRCPFTRACLAYALTHAVEGVWGGTTGNQRDTLRRRHKIAAAAITIPDQVLASIDIDRMDQGGLPPEKSPPTSE